MATYPAIKIARTNLPRVAVDGTLADVMGDSSVSTRVVADTVFQVDLVHFPVQQADWETIRDFRSNNGAGPHDFSLFDEEYELTIVGDARKTERRGPWFRVEVPVRLKRVG